MSEHTFDGAHIIPRQHSLFQNAAEYLSGEDLLTRDPCAVYGIVSIGPREISKICRSRVGKQKRRSPGHLGASRAREEDAWTTHDATSSAGTISAHGANRERAAFSVCKHGHSSFLLYLGRAHSVEKFGNYESLGGKRYARELR